jgi:hypothetical protein
MRGIILSTLTALTIAVSASAEMTQETTTTTTTYTGTVSSVSPSSSTIIFKSAAASDVPMKYVYSERTSWVDATGNTVTRESVQNQPVTIYYEKQGDQLVVSKVVMQEPLPAPRVEKKTSTTTTTTTEPAE